MSTAPYRLLMIEDDHRLSAMVKTYLEQSEFLCMVADTGVAGFEALQAETPDVVLLDLILPDTDGLSICKQIRGSQAAYANVPILMLTAKSTELDRVLGLELGAPALRQRSGAFCRTARPIRHRARAAPRRRHGDRE